MGIGRRLLLASVAISAVIWMAAMTPQVRADDPSDTPGQGRGRGLGRGRAPAGVAGQDATPPGRGKDKGTTAVTPAPTPAPTPTPVRPIRPIQPRVDGAVANGIGQIVSGWAHAGIHGQELAARIHQLHAQRKPAKDAAKALKHQGKGVGKGKHGQGGGQANPPAAANTGKERTDTAVTRGRGASSGQGQGAAGIGSRAGWRTRDGSTPSGGSGRNTTPKGNDAD